MKFKIDFCSEQQYLPTQRCKNLKKRYVKHTSEVDITEVEKEDFPVAFEITERRFNVEFHKEIRCYDRKLYKLVKCLKESSSLSCIVNDKLTNIFGQLMEERDSSFAEKSIVINDDVKKQEAVLSKKAENYIIFKGNLWKRCNEPGYVVITLSSHSIAFGIASRRNKSNGGEYFTAFEKERAIAYAKQQVAIRADAADYVEEFAATRNIRVLMPEMVTKYYKTISKQEFFLKCKSIKGKKFEGREFEGEIEGVPVKVINEGHQFCIHIFKGRGIHYLFFAYCEFEDIWEQLVKEIRSYQYLPFLETYEVNGYLFDVLSAVHDMLEHRITQLDASRETNRIENLKIAAHEIQNLIS